MTWQPGMNPAKAKWNRPGINLRRDRSPVAPNNTTTCGCFGPNPFGAFAMCPPHRYSPPLTRLTVATGCNKLKGRNRIFFAWQ